MSCAARAVWTLTVALSWTLITTDAESCTHYAAVGREYNIPLDSGVDITGNRLTWKKQSISIYISGRSQSSTHQATGNGALILPKVSSADGGTYSYEITNNDGKPVKSNTLSLCVQELLTKPKVTFKCDEKQAKVEFTCTTSQTEDVEYRWLEADDVVANEEAQKLLRTSKQLGSNSFRCKVSNRVSSETSDPIKQDCLKPPSLVPTGRPGPDQSSDEEENLLFGLDFWLMVAILAGGGGLVLILIVATIVCCSINRRKRRMQIKDEQELRLQWSTSNNQPYANQRGHSPRPGPNQGPTQGPAQRPAPGPTRDSAGHTGPRPPKARLNRPRPPDPITGQPLPGPRRQADTGQTKVSMDDEETPPPLPQPRSKTPKRTQNH